MEYVLPKIRRKRRRRKQKRSTFCSRGRKHRIYYQPYSQDELSNKTISKFCSSFDPIKYFRCLQLLPTGTIEPKVKTKQYQNILIVATEFQPSWRNSMDISKECTIYLLNKDKDPPIMIDTGALISLTSLRLDFVGPIRPCLFSHLSGLSNKTKVVGQGKVSWTI